LPINLGAPAKSFQLSLSVIPVKTGIQEFQHSTQNLDTRFVPSLGLLRTSRWYDDICECINFQP